jgi:hypothetical protein
LTDNLASFPMAVTTSLVSQEKLAGKTAAGAERQYEETAYG